MKVIFLNRFFHPDISPTSQILSDLAFHLAPRADVHVVTSRLRYDRAGDALPAEEQVRGVTVHRVWSSGFGRRSLAGVAGDFATFYAAATMRLIRLARPGDVIVAMTDPPMASVPAWVAARVTGARTVNWLQDIFPEVAWALDFRRLPRVFERVLAWPRDRSLRAARMNVALGALMADHVASRGVDASRVRVIPNWAPGDEIRPRPAEGNPLREAWGLDGRFVVGYSGNMGRAHDFDALLEAAARLRADDRVRFLLIGDGNRRGALEREVAGRGLTNVILKPYQPRERLAESLTAPDCHIVSLRPSLEGLIVPSKLYSSLAAGRPVIFIGSLDGEVARVMRAESAFGPIGTCVAPDDVDGLVRAIQALADDAGEAARRGANGRRLFEARFDRRYALDAWAVLMEEAGA